MNESIALERTQLLNEAYKTLKDPAKKADYDRALKAFLQRASYAAPKKEEKKAQEEPKQKQEAEKQQKQPDPPKQNVRPKAKTAPDPLTGSLILESIKKAAARAINIAPTLPKPILVGLAIVVLLCTVTFIDMIYRAASGIVSPSEIDSGIFTFGNDRNDISFRVKVIVL